MVILIIKGKAKDVFGAVKQLAQNNPHKSIGEIKKER